MNLDEIDKKCFILALFIRDDGQRFLLGSGAYEFKDSQLHFSANTMANDVVEVQGNDGYLLAGQVRRPTTQVFDGYIGDASINKPDIEGYRRDFFAFFQKNHFYTVVYIFPDGTSIQRRRGFIVDAGEVRELYQMFPEYHIGLNFEDVNYYKYSEDEDGNEQYAKSIDINISKAVSGGLIWDEVSQEQAYNHGTDFSISGTIEDEPVDHIDLYGDIEQTTYSGKNLLQNNTTTQTISGVTFTVNSDGSITINGTSTAQILYVINNSVALTGVYTMSGVPDDNSSSDSTYFLQLYGTGGTNDYGKGATTSNINAVCRIVVRSGVTVNNKVVRPMIEAGRTKTDYEPYVGGTASPNPDYPQEVQTVTGEQTITISDGNGQSQSYTVDLGDIELCKIGDYQDYIYKSGNDWYVKKNIGKSAMGSLTWNPASTGTSGVYRMYSDGIRSSVAIPATGSEIAKIVCSHYTPETAANTWSTMVGVAVQTTDGRLFVYDSNYNTNTSQSAFTTWLTNNNVVIYYALRTSTDTQITDATLIAQLEALNSATTYDGVTWFKTESEYLPADTWAYVQIQAGGGVVWDNYGATWEEGGGGMIVNVNVDSIENVYPVWTVNGPTDTPILTNLTTGTSITYNGNITASQTLVVDMLNQTALLNGTSVIGKLSGDWIELAPGMNRMSYTATNEQTAPKSTLEWQEIVG